MNNLLFIAPEYFGYEIKIKNKLENLGYNVCYICENIDYKLSIYKVILYLMKKIKNIQYLKFVNIIMDRIINYYYRHQIDKYKDSQFKVVLVIRGAYLSESIMTYIRNRFKEAKFVLYLWDSIKKYPNSLNLLKYFDKVSTFDCEDSFQYNICYRPLFCSDLVECSVREKEYNLMAISSFSLDRLKIYEKLIDFVDKKKLRSFIKLFHYSKISFFISRFIKKEINLNNIKINKELVFQNLSLDEIYSLYSKSNIVFDYCHNEQAGFTMRTIEALIHGCKLLTNNCFIKESNLYNENNVFIYDSEIFSIPDYFINSPFLKYSSDIYGYYSLDNWIKDVLSLDNNNKKVLFNVKNG